MPPEDARDPAVSARQAIAGVLERISQAWQRRDYVGLAEAFAEEMVFAFPAGAGRLEGAAAIAASYREFMDRIELTEYREASATIDIWEDTAVASFEWEMRWLADGVANHERGQDTFVLRRVSELGPGRWVAVWRTMSFAPTQPSEAGGSK